MVERNLPKVDVAGSSPVIRLMIGTSGGVPIAIHKNQKGMII